MATSAAPPRRPVLSSDAADAPAPAGGGTTAEPRAFTGSGTYAPPRPGPIVTIGNFDGVHVGHRALLDRARGLAGPDRRVCVLTFDPPPRAVLRPGQQVPPIQSMDDRIATLHAAGADDVVVEPFDRAYATQTADAFAADIVAGRLGAAGVVIGWDFRFGRDRAGGVDALRAAVPGPVEQVGGVTLDGGIVSSTRVREAVAAGDVEAAARWLARPHALVGPVVAGDGRGRTLGVPTANVVVDTALCPPPGVYAVCAQVAPGGPWRPAVANLGDRPTFGPTRGRLEVHLVDGAPVPDLAGRTLRSGLVARLRDERRFADLDALVAQIHRDIDAARRALEASPWCR